MCRSTGDETIGAFRNRPGETRALGPRAPAGSNDGRRVARGTIPEDEPRAGAHRAGVRSRPPAGSGDSSLDLLRGIPEVEARPAGPVSARTRRSHRAERRGRGGRVGSVPLMQLDVPPARTGAAQIAHGEIAALELDPEEIIAARLAVVGHPDAKV